MLWFDSDEAMRSAIATEAGRALVADEGHFIGDLRIVAVDQVEVIPPATDRPLIKRMSLLRRRPDVSPERFQHEWRVEHARLVREVKGVLGYRQNLVVAREVPKGTPVGYEDLPIDGIVELWFENPEALDAAFASPQGVTLMAPAAIGQLVGTLRGLDFYSTQHRQVCTRSPNRTAKTTPGMIGLSGLLVDFKRHRRNPSP